MYQASRTPADAGDYEEAKERVLRILNARDRTSHEILTRLRDDGYNEEVVERLVARFTEIGLIDDERYTEFYLAAARASNKGWYRITRELRGKGIDVGELTPPDADEEAERAFTIIERLSVTTPKERERALRRLTTKGFSYEVALRALEMKKIGEKV